MRKRKPTNGRVVGVKFPKEQEEQDLKKVKEQLLKELEEKEKSDKTEWFDKELDKNLGNNK